MKIYLAGPMSGIPQFNAPAFIYAAADLRGHGYDVVSPYEVDVEHGIGEAIRESTDGDVAQLTAKTGETWGTLLARDVKIIADGGITDIVCLPGWEQSKGVKLEVFVGMLANLDIWQYERGTQIEKYSRHQILEILARVMGGSK